jgi:tetratricopeptide (TPR) repeat protein
MPIFCTYAQDLVVSSTPKDSEVFIKPLSGGDYIKIGKTPFNIKIKELVNRYAKSSHFIVKISKENFKTKEFVMNNLADSDIKMDINLEIKDDLKQMKKFDIVINDLFEAQRLARSKDYDDSITKLEKASKDFPFLSVTQELLGSVYYLKKDFRKSLAYYSKALELNNENVHAYKMKTLIQKSLGIKETANEK